MKARFEPKAKIDANKPSVGIPKILFIFGFPFLVVFILYLVIRPVTATIDPLDARLTVDSLNAQLEDKIGRREFYIQNFYLLLLNQVITQAQNRRVELNISSINARGQSVLSLKGITSSKSKGSSFNFEGVLDFSGEDVNGRQMLGSAELKLIDGYLYANIIDYRGVDESEFSALGFKVDQWFPVGITEAGILFSDLSGMDAITPVVQNFNPKLLGLHYDQNPMFESAESVGEKSFFDLTLNCMLIDIGGEPQGELGLEVCKTEADLPLIVTIKMKDEDTTVDMEIRIIEEVRAEKVAQPESGL
ncbi:MAG: hypothetical protein ACE5DX_05995 [Candidatus Dojkabacteria bacterium]